MKKYILILAILLTFTGLCTFSEDLTPDFGPYMKNMQKNIKNNWQPPMEEESKRVVVTYKIKKNGKLKDLQIYQSSSNSKLDKSALEAVKKTKFEPLPKDFKGEEIPVQFTFDYNAHKN